uniref:Sulfotransferase n=1 Tax=Spermophilus dauricus TaxID=99837 RepID=A0A8C9UMH3_SPEDA
MASSLEKLTLRTGSPGPWWPRGVGASDTGPPAESGSQPPLPPGEEAGAGQALAPGPCSDGLAPGGSVLPGRFCWVLPALGLGASAPESQGLPELTSPRLIKSHLPYRFLPSDLHNGDSKVIYMARNPKDLVVSYYQFHRSLRTMSYRGTFQEFCRRFMNDKLGYGSWFEHVQEFWEHRMDANVLFLKYEDMHRDLVTMVEQLARFLGVSCDKAQLESLSEHCHQLATGETLSRVWRGCVQGHGQKYSMPGQAASPSPPCSSRSSSVHIQELKQGPFIPR